MAILGFAFITAAVLSLIRVRALQWRHAQDALFLLGLAAALVVQLIAGLDVIAYPDDTGTMRTIAIVLAVCFFIGIARAWELIGGPSIGIGREVGSLVRGKERPAEND